MAAWSTASSFAGSAVLRGWTLWDGRWYVEIANAATRTTRAAESSVAFFPVYPLLVRAFGAVVSAPLAAIGTTIVAGAAALTLFTRWCRDRLPTEATVASVLLLALYPYAFFLYGAAYGDALFLAVPAIGAFLLLDRGLVVPAALLPPRSHPAPGSSAPPSPSPWCSGSSSSAEATAAGDGATPR